MTRSVLQLRYGYDPVRWIVLHKLVPEIYKIPNQNFILIFPRDELNENYIQQTRSTTLSFN